MIEKLKTINPYEQTEIDMDVNSVAGLVYENTPLVQKINELVDAVNGILDYAPLEMAMKAEPADPYAEQRKWIGKACWFWDDGAKTRVFGKLNQVDTEYNDAPFQTNFGQWYEHCEPVKPEDDIIYKGE